MNRVALACVLLASLLVACAPKSFEPDPWYRVPEDASYRQWPELRGGRLHEVAESKLDEAVAQLEEVSIVELTEQEAEGLLGKPLPGSPGTTPYLVRAVFLNKGTGRFLIYMSGDQIAVFHGSLGGGERAMGRQPLVLQLEELPAEVYVTARMVE